MRRFRWAFVGLVALIACSTYGESVTDDAPPAPTLGTDGGGSSSARDGSVDGDIVVLPDGGEPTPDGSGGGTGTPKIVQAAGDTFSGSTGKLVVAFPKAISNGNSILVCAGGSGGKVTGVSVSNVALDQIAFSSMYGAMSGWLKTVPADVLGRVEVGFETAVGNPSVIAVELENAVPRGQTSGSGIGNIAAGGLAMNPNDMLFGCALGSGVTPEDPIGGKAVIAPQGMSGETMVAAAALTTVATSPKITWPTPNGASKWDSISIAFEPAK